MTYEIDTTFDFRDDAGKVRGTGRDRDPDQYSPTLRRYHQMLWSKPLPNGEPFDLVATTPGAYLHHRSRVGEFKLSSDSVVPSFRKEKSLVDAKDALPPGRFDCFMHIGYTIGGMMIFPGNKVNREMTINGSRGLNQKIKDRFDLTVECIRRHYKGGDSPLSDTLEARYGFASRMMLKAESMPNEFTAIVEQDGTWYIARCPEIPGANGQGKTKSAALDNLSEAISLILEDRLLDAHESDVPTN